MKIHPLAYSAFKRAAKIRRLVKNPSVARVIDIVFARCGFDRVKIGRDVLYLDPLDRGVAWPLLSKGIYEPFETAVIARLLKKGMFFADVGANIGYYTLLASRIAGADGLVAAFEPEPANFALLEKNIRSNGLTNVRAFQKAAGDRRGNIPLYLSSDNFGDHRVYDSENGRKNIMVEICRLDDFVPQFTDRAPDLVKIDVQGAEPLVFEGLRGLVEKNPGMMILLEFWPYGMTAAGFSPESFLVKLRSAGFRLHALDPRTGTISSSGDGEIINLCPGEKHVNILCTRDNF
jgi:FkbM family methyltransferase